MNVKSILKCTSNLELSLPSFLAPVSAGFPSPAEDLIDKKLDLNEALIAHPAATFFVRVEGESMKDGGILDKDLLIVDRSLNPKNGQVVVAVINGEFTVKKIKKDKNRLFLMPENKKFSPLEITEEMDFRIWGVVTYAIHSL